MLSCYRVLDLTDEKAFICGRALSDFGAEVIKIEKPGGDPSRHKGPFYGDDPDPEKNLTWFSFNANKKGITLDIESTEGQEILKKLVKTSDVVIESFAPGYLDGLGLGYKALSEINPGIILTSITGFGQEGPYRDYKDPDIVVRALGGPTFTCGYDDRPPLTTSYHHTHYLGAMQGAVGTMIALNHRALTGQGQHVDAPVQQSLVFVCSAETEGPYALFGEIPSRHGRARIAVKLKDGSEFYNPLLWPCQDGYIALNLLLNPASTKNNVSMMEYLKKDGIDIGFWEDWDWANKSWEHMSREEADSLMDVLGQFFMNHNKEELLQLAIENRFQLGPCNNAADVLKHPQLQARDFWRDIEHPELGASLKYPGPAVVSSEGYYGIKHRAPLIGEHNDEVYVKGLGMSADEVLALKERRVI
jgi:benzylsuccinate CoA-transferase BbsE subunit/naphthyl-2-methylsuccinate CoA transferase subunit